MYMVEFMQKVADRAYVNVGEKQFIEELSKSIHFTLPFLATGEHLAQMAWDYSWSNPKLQKEEATQMAMALCDNIINSR